MVLTVVLARLSDLLLRVYCEGPYNTVNTSDTIDDLINLSNSHS